MTSAFASKQEHKYDQPQLLPAWQKLLQKIPVGLTPVDLGGVYERLRKLADKGVGEVHSLGRAQGQPVFAYELRPRPRLHDNKRLPVVVSVAAPEGDEPLGVSWNLWLAETLSRKASESLLQEISLHFYFVFVLAVAEAPRSSQGWGANNLSEYYRHSEAPLSSSRRILDSFPVRYHDWLQPPEYPGRRGCEHHNECQQARTHGPGAACTDVEHCEMRKMPEPPREESVLLAAFLESVRPDLIYVSGNTDFNGYFHAQTRWQPTVAPLVADALSSLATVGMTPVLPTSGRRTKPSARDTFFNAQPLDQRPLLFLGVEEKWREFHEHAPEWPDGRRYAGNVAVEDFVTATLPRTQLVINKLPLWACAALGNNKDIKKRITVTVEVSASASGKRPWQARYYARIPTPSGPRRQLLYTEGFLKKKDLPAVGKQKLILTRAVTRRVAHLRTAAVLDFLQQSYDGLLPRLFTPTALEEEFLLALQEVGAGLHQFSSVTHETPFHSSAATTADVAAAELQHILASAKVTTLLVKVLEAQERVDATITKKLAHLLQIHKETCRFLDGPQVKRFAYPLLASLQMRALAAYASDFAGPAQVGLLEEEALAASFRALQAKRAARKARYQGNMRRRADLAEDEEHATAEAVRTRSQMNQRRQASGLPALRLSSGHNGAERADDMRFVVVEHGANIALNAEGLRSGAGAGERRRPY